MKKIIAAAAGLMLVGTMVSTASAVESQFGGYWRTRMFTQIDMDGQASGTKAAVDTRTRLYYTAVFNENFKFVNKFEFNTTWGDTNGGNIGTDGVGNFRIKNSYVDVKTGAVRTKMGMQGLVVARGFLFDDDMAGLVVSVDAGPVTVPMAWIKASEKNVTDWERDVYAVLPIIKISDGITLNPYFVYDKLQSADWNDYFLGIDFDAKGDSFGGWGTAIYNFGETGGRDSNAWLFAAGFNAGPVYGQAFYATGQSDFAADSDVEAWIAPPGNSYYWAEIMGLGTFDNTASGGSPGNNLSNIWAANIGAKVKPTDTLTLSGDIWYASLVEEVVPGADTDLGLEFDFKATIAVMDNLKLDLIAAYLLAGDATGPEDPIEIGARLSLSF